MQRRDFLVLSGAALSASDRILGANNRIRVALIGAGGRGRSVASWVPKAPNAEVVAACDVYSPRREEAASAFGSVCAPVKDYREVLDRKDIDGVVIATPDHWHVPMTLDAISAGKDVYVEKPVTHSIEEAEQLLEAAANSPQVIATGTQQRSWDHYLQARDLVSDGGLGKMALVQCYWYQNYGLLGTMRSIKTPIDASKLDWKQWLGSAPKQDFNETRYRYWRFFSDFGGGIFTDLLTHWIDVIQWFMETPSPKSAQASGDTCKITDFELPDTTSAIFQFPNNYLVVFYGSLAAGVEAGGIIFRGDKAMLKLTRSGFSVYEEAGVPFETNPLPAAAMEVKSTGDGTKANVENWLDCIRSRKTPNANIRAGVEAARTSHLANQAMREQRTVLV